MGHITRVSNTIVEFAKRSEQLEGYMEGSSNWMKFIADDLKLENEQLNTQLGGHRPTALADDDGDDFTLFALNDITNNNDMDEDGNDLWVITMRMKRMKRSKWTETVTLTLMMSMMRM
eukprot:TRINITY_DN271_c0_g1_i2.p1 TRINITY_DN271_c0_g1~~TRINITY_DN271_c0_g1_i2.p1  ORF type:complete len:118 (+),score=18.79 TRINITY_DN271_c0_g1_i2:519-872(+)